MLKTTSQNAPGAILADIDDAEFTVKKAAKLKIS
jgi:hypothetical protein